MYEIVEHDQKRNENRKLVCCETAWHVPIHIMLVLIAYLLESVPNWRHSADDIRSNRDFRSLTGVLCASQESNELIKDKIVLYKISSTKTTF